MQVRLTLRYGFVDPPARKSITEVPLIYETISPASPPAGHTSSLRERSRPRKSSPTRVPERITALPDVRLEQPPTAEVPTRDAKYRLTNGLSKTIGYTGGSSPRGNPSHARTGSS